jgi:beta-phosphoglucomutase
MTLQGFIFDLDGVLTDTAEYHFRAWQKLAHEEDIPFTREDNEALRGVPRRDSLMLVLKGRIYSEEQIQQMMVRKNNDYQNFIRQITPADLLPGAKELLLELRQAGIKAAVGSSSKNAPEVIERLEIGSLLDAVADGYSVERAKPAPDLFLFAANKLGLPPKVCVVVEDAAAGIDAAIAGGFHTIGLGPKERVGHAQVVYPSLAGVGLKQILSALS